MSSSLRFRLLPAAALAALALAGVAGGRADDRALLRTGTGNPFLMILFDTSGSMNWSPKCTAEQVAAGICTYLCPTGDCPVPRDGDDPASKFRQAKEALYEVIRGVSNVDFGFATFNQDNLRITNKHWLYRVSATQANGLPALVSGASYPAAGMDWVFGATFDCDRGNGDNEIGCRASVPADTNDPWELTRVARWPKTGVAGTTLREFWIRDAGQVYHVAVDDPGAALPYGAATMSVSVKVDRCTAAACDIPSRWANVFDNTITFDRVGDFAMWDFQTQRNPEQGGFFGIQYSAADNTCEGWDPNNDTNLGNDGEDDDYRDSNGNTYNLKQNSIVDPYGRTPAALFTYGDVIPLDWRQNNRSLVLDRLAPRLGGGDPTGDPEAFGNATYLANSRAGTDQFLRALNEGQKPLFPNGSTPLGYSLGSLRSWFRGCLNGSCPQDTGWDDVAAASDVNWECRKKYLLVITDGDDTCPGRDPCSLTASMHSLDDITTYVVAFGVENTSGNRLNCMAANGGSGDPIYPQNKQELVDALNRIIGEILEQAASFASAAVPSVQANVADKIYLSSFVPLNGESVWPGSLDAFLKPLPLDADGQPDLARRCNLSVVSECYLFDGADHQPAWNGEAGYDPKGLLLQAPLAGDVLPGPTINATLKIGAAADERRVFFGLPNDSTVPGKRQYFQVPTLASPEQSEFEYVWNLSTLPADDAANLALIQNVVVETLVEKQGEVTDPITNVTSHIQYVMGDIFHSNPEIVERPNNFDYFSKDLYYNTPLCGQTLVQTRQRTSPPTSYQYFANTNSCRRKLLMAGSNDGQVHVFDTGIFEGVECKYPDEQDRDNNGSPDGEVAPGDGPDGAFDNGTGREIFSFIPAKMMPTVKQLTETNSIEGIWGVDGSFRTADVFIDPDHAGTPACLDRQWRTIVIGSYREGGPGYFALDITQPDLIDPNTYIPQPVGGPVNGYVPSCLGTAFGPPANCGPLPFPAKLWEFSDVTDEDASGSADLGESWSRAVVERIPICTADCAALYDNDPLTTATVEDRFVAIFGGGLPEQPTHSADDTLGNWIYMVDVETGRILYKRGGVARASASDAIVGSVPADVATVDTNNDGLIDKLYFGTTAGYVYKVDLGFDPLEISSVTGRIEDPVTDDGRYDPYQVFDTFGRPVYYEISVVYLPSRRAYALAFGTGDRWNLWSFAGQEGRFYMIVDTGFVDADRDGMLDAPCGSCADNAPLTENAYVLINPDDAFDINVPGTNYLFENVDTPGYYFRLAADDRLITEPFALSGIATFTVYKPTEVEIAADDPPGGGGGNNDDDVVCAYGGESRIFIVDAVSGIGYARDPGSQEFTRYLTVPKFTTQPFAEMSTTRNPDSGSGGANSDQMTDELLAVRRQLERLLPSGVRFANYTINIKTIRSDTGIVFIAPVPVGIDPHNYKEF